MTDESSLTPLAHGGGPGDRDTIGRLQSHLGSHPQDPRTWFDLGVALNSARRFEESVAALRSALVLSPDNLSVQREYAVSLSGLGAVDAAAELLEEIIQRSPGDGWAYFHLGSVRYRQGDMAQAAALWECASRCIDDPAESLESLAIARRRLGDAEGERECWRRVMEIQPHNPAAPHMMSACGGAPVRPRADDGYVVHLFDRFAADFDRVLTGLGYRVPEVAEAWMRSRWGEARGRLRVLDAGCGTGLCGERLRPWASHLTGVDLSEGMIERARGRGCYDTLERAELVAFLRSHRAEFDVIVAGDVLCYFGELAEFVGAARGALRAGGALAFSVEAAQEPEAPGGYVLRPHGRYAHSRSYIEHILENIRTFDATVIRAELGAPVPGYWVAADPHSGHAAPLMPHIE